MYKSIEHRNDNKVYLINVFGWESECSRDQKGTDEEIGHLTYNEMTVNRHNGLKDQNDRKN